MGFPQYGFKASRAARACPGGNVVKPTPGMPKVPAEFAPCLRGAGRYGIGTQPVPAPGGNPARSSLPAPPLTPGVLGSGRVVLSRPSSLIRPHPPVSGAPGDFTVLPLLPRALVRRARRKRPPRPSLLSLPRCPSVPRTLRRWVRRPSPAVRGRTMAGFLAFRPSRHPQPRLCQQSPAGGHFDAASFALCCGPPVCLALLAGSDAESRWLPWPSEDFVTPA